jgi:hypothetical protein
VVVILSPSTPPFFRRTSRAPTLALVSPSSRSSAQGSRISAFATWRMKGVLSAVRCKPVRGCRPSFRRVWRTFITNSIRLPVNQSCAVCLCGVSAPRAIGKESMLLILEILWASRPHSHPHSRTYLSTLLGIPCYPSLTAPAHLRSVPLTNGKSSSPTASMASGSIGTSSISINLLGDIQ